ncbi:MAG: hypothetical protein IT443_00265 [Phycisphaeraceae bacterium]|nr:hypothetical protein [Phycisphaeraceae bacterium]
MYQFKPAGKITGYPQAHELKTPEIRSYQQIAETLVERGDPALTPTRVAHICRVAELKLVHALLTDPVVHDWLYPDGNSLYSAN